MGHNSSGLLLGFPFHKTPQDIQLWETTFRATTGSLQGLNIDRLLFNPLRGLTVVERNDVLNGLSRALRSRPALTLPLMLVPLQQTGTFAQNDTEGTVPIVSFLDGTDGQAYVAVVDVYI